MYASQFFLNVSILVSISVVSALIFEAASGRNWLHKVLQGLLFGLMAVLSMSFPVHMDEGIFFDLRSVIISLGAWFFGPLTAGLALGASVPFRIAAGGAGVLSGTLVLFISAAAGLAFYSLRPLERHLPSVSTLIFFGIGLHVIILLVVAAVLPSHFPPILAPYFLTIHPMATALAGKVLLNQYHLRSTLETLRQKNEHIELITDSMREVFWILDLPDLSFSYISPSNTQHTGYPPEEAVQRSLEETLTPESYQTVQGWLQTDLARFKDLGRADSEEVRLIEERCKDGSTIWSEVTFSILTSPEGIPERVAGVSRNVTRRVKQEIALQESEQKYRELSEALQRSLKEKNALLKEVHHRVKNNLQIITSLLRLEAARIREPESREVVVDMQRRVRSMSLLHETVYQSNSLARVDMRKYLQTLVRQILNTMSAEHRHPRPTLEIDPLEFDLDEAIPCGLLLTELLSNACKHAFEPEQAGEVTVRLASPAPGMRLLEVSDNGKGLPPDFEERRRHSLGLQLVDDLTRQLNGTLTRPSGPLTTFRITFPEQSGTNLHEKTSFE